MPSPITGTTIGGLTSVIRETYTTPLLAAIQVGSTVQASHLNLISGFINAVNTHTHTVQEYTSLYEFGNINGGTILNTRTTSTGGTPSVANVASTGATITAAHHNTLGTAINASKSHSHTFSDDVP